MCFGFVCVVVPKCNIKYANMEDLLCWLGECKCIWRAKSDVYIVTSRVFNFQEGFVKFVSIRFIWNFEVVWSTNLSIWIQKRFELVCVAVSKCIVKHKSVEVSFGWDGQCKCISRGKSNVCIVSSRISNFQERFVKFLSICFVWKSGDGWNT